MHSVRILKTQKITSDVKSFLIQKPQGYTFVPGQAADLTLTLPQFSDKPRPFTIVSALQAPHLEFIVKRVPYEKAVTNKMHSLKEGAELKIEDAQGTLSFKGPGLFIAAGTGITPFLAMARHAEKNFSVSSLLYSTKTFKSLLFEKELSKLFGDAARVHLTQEIREGYGRGRITQETLEPYISKHQRFYICGPMQFVVDTKKNLDDLGVRPEKVIMEL